MTEEYFEYQEPAAIGVSFRRSGKIYYFAPSGLRVRQGDRVLAETDKGLDIGDVVFVKYDLPEAEEGQPLKPLLRQATAQDLAKEQELQQKEREARKLCAEKIVAHHLPMRLIAADYTFDGQRLVFFFSSEARVDFRALVRDLAETFKTRIELRQVGVRDQAKMVGGLGPCGRPLCCNAFLRNFDPVGIRVAKDQGLSLNPAKISGICDRLMCCLKYEHETYLELARKLPKVGMTVNTVKGPAVVKSVNLMHERLHVRYPNDDQEDLKASQVWGLDEEAPPAATLAPVETEKPEPLTRLQARPPRPQERERPSRGERVRPPREARRSPVATPEAAPPETAAPEGEEQTGSRRRRRRRDKPRKPTEGQAPAAASAAPPSQGSAPAAPAGPSGETPAAAEGARRKRRPRIRRRKPGGSTPGSTPPAQE